jgi:hypothetical protein
MGTTYGQTNRFIDNFEFLDESKWNVHGNTFGTVTSSNGELLITNTSGSSTSYIGVSTIQTFSVGTTITVRSRDLAGRHCSLIGFGASGFYPYPHAAGGNFGCTWYSRGDIGTSTISIRSENNATLTYEGVTQDLRQYQIFKLKRVSSSVVEFYRNDVLEYTATGLVLANNYSAYFSNDGWSNPNSTSIDYISVV